MANTRLNRRLTESEFETAVGALRLAERNVRVARAVLVAGLGVMDVARHEGVTRQVISQAVARVYASHLHLRQLPDDWVRVTVTVPPAVAVEVEDLAAKAVATLDRERQSEAIRTEVAKAIRS